MHQKRKETDFQAILIDWYIAENRPLPWRSTQDPYKIWLSEIILQQTRVDQGLPYYLKFVQKYPHVRMLAEAPEDEVLRLWQGLGYYSRARNLHFTAKYISQELNEKFPASAAELEKLKGVGKYTAAAIASFAYNEATAVCDGNVQRVLARVFGFDNDISSGKGLKFFQEQAQLLISKDSPATYNQAIMEFGATQCTPKNMNCEECVLRNMCYAYAHNEQQQLPVKTKKIKQKHRYFNYFVFEAGEKFFLQKRGPKDIWQGLYEFFNKETETKIPDNEIIASLQFDGDVLSVSPDYKHILSHQVIWARFFHVKLKTIPPFLNEAFFFYSDDVEALPKPILLVNYLNRLKK